MLAQTSTQQPSGSVTTSKTSDEKTITNEEVDASDHLSATRISPLRKAKAATLNKEEKDFVKDNCLWGTPDIADLSALGPVQVVAREGYVWVIAPTQRFPIGSVSIQRKASLAGRRSQQSAFHADPNCLPGARSELADTTSLVLTAATWRRQLMRKKISS